MIRAKDKSNKSYVYIYYIYEAYNYSLNKVCTYYLSSCDSYTGLLVLKEDEIEDLEILVDNYIRIAEFQPSAGQKDLIHPVLYHFLEDDWQIYEGIVEGVEEAWLKFEKELNHRP